MKHLCLGRVLEAFADDAHIELLFGALNEPITVYGGGGALAFVMPYRDVGACTPFLQEERIA